MARKIKGKITNQEGRGVGELRVQAWDDDWPDGDDLMGQTVTDAQGNYAIDYDDKQWDSAPPAIAAGRPDIFIAVQVKTGSGAWAHLGRSPVYENQDLRKDRTINLKVPVLPLEKKRTTFDPQRHGFRFVNSFKLDPSVLGFDLGSWNLGFCGGMSAGALQRFDEQQRVPAATRAPRRGTELYEELLYRQLRSLPPGVVQQIYDWQSAPDEDQWNRKRSIGYRTRQQWPGLKAELDAGRPTQLVLIRTEGYLSNMSVNHQVLAIGYQWNPTTKDLVISLYDPNLPRKTTSLTMNLGLPGGRLDGQDSSGAPFRGFFVNPAGADAAA